MATKARKPSAAKPATEATGKQTSAKATTQGKTAGKQSSAKTKVAKTTGSASKATKKTTIKSRAVAPAKTVKTAEKSSASRSSSRKTRAQSGRAKELAPPPSPPPASKTTSDEGDVLRLRDAPLPYEIIEGEPYMGPKQKEHFRRILEAWRHELMEEVDRTVRYMQDEAANFPDANDRATQESEFSLELRTRDRERKLIRKIDEALSRIETDEYGYCVTCGDEIGIRRLEARPIATQCIDCKERDEKRERQLRGF